MSLLRLIAKLEIKGHNVIKGVQMEGLRIVGQPKALAEQYAQDADEILYIDTVATLYGRNQLGALLEETTEKVFVPITVGGGIREISEVQRLLNSGADKVAINSAAIRSPRLVRDIAERYGSQCVVVSIEAKKRADGGWEAYTDNGRERSGKDAIAWAFEAVELGAGELLITSIDRDGTRKGFDVDLIKQIAPHVPVPVVACGGMGCLQHLRQVLSEGKADAVAMASVLHYGEHSVGALRKSLAAA